MYYKENYNIEAKVLQEDFVALDFETVNVEAGGFFGDTINMRVPCQVGLVVVEKGKVNEEKSLNINVKPIGIEECYPISEFSLKWIATHTQIIEPEMQDKLDPKKIWANAETFDKIWPRMLELIGDKPIVAHMATVERSTIVNACNHYGLQIPDSLNFVCTKLTSEVIDEKYFGYVEQGQGLRTLTTCCSRYGIDFSEDEHHDAYLDAKVTAELMLKMSNGIMPISYDDMKEIVWPEVNGLPLLNKRVVLTGQFYIYQERHGIHYRRYFTYSERNTIFKDWLISLGAKFTKTPSINSKLNVLLVGEEPGSAKVKKVRELQQQGNLIEIFTQESLNNRFFENKVCVEEKVQDNPFKGRRIAVIGSFKYDIKILRDRFRRLGANIDSKVSRYTHYALIGHSVSKEKIEEVNDVIIRRGWNVRVLDENDVDNILKEKYTDLYTNNEVKKNLTLDYNYHIEPNMLVLSDETNPVYEENVYVPSNIKGRRDLIAQIFGNVGAYVNDEIVNASDSDKTKPVVILTSETLEKIKNNDSDEITKYIENIYNNSNAIALDYQFVEEKKILEWITQRSIKNKDKYTLELLEKYNNVE